MARFLNQFLETELFKKSSNGCGSGGCGSAASDGCGSAAGGYAAAASSPSYHACP